MNSLKELLEKNRVWSEEIRQRDPEFFRSLAEQQNPRYLWIGCSDSRVPATQLVGLRAGELFVHRNVANLAVHTDLNYLSVLQFAVDVLGINHVIVCGHYGCGGVEAALNVRELGLIDNWLRHIEDVMLAHQTELSELPTQPEKLNRLCELNVIEQVRNVTRTTIVQNAWNRGHELTIHGWIYSIGDGLLRDLNASVSAPVQPHEPKATPGATAAESQFVR
jgi:carbonic anhydrase